MNTARELTLATSILLALGAPSAALDPAHCKAKINTKDGVVLVEAKAVSGTLLWGTAAGREIFPLFNNASSCISPDPKKCQLGAIGTPEQISPPPACTIYLKDTGDSSTCSAYVKKCVPMRRRPCPSDMVTVGSFCIDKFEASVWNSPTGTTQYGIGGAHDYPCADSGQNCSNVYARSVVAVPPSETITWFQAQQACRNVGKRLPTSSEWQQAVGGTPDPGPDNGTTDCNSAGVLAVNTGSRSSCVSMVGAFDMVGNVYEWVADWMPRSTTCLSWGGLSNDGMCLAGAETSGAQPGALLRGGRAPDGSSNGPLDVLAGYEPSAAFSRIGVRCAR
jgi:hypothetical protein